MIRILSLGQRKKRAAFKDPDGNSWLLQEVATRFPGRVRLERNEVRLGGRSGERDAPCRAAHGENTRSGHWLVCGMQTGRTGTPSTLRRSSPVGSSRNRVRDDGDLQRQAVAGRAFGLKAANVQCKRSCLLWVESGHVQCS